MADEKPSLPFYRAEAGDEDYYNHLRYPHVNGNGTIRLFPEDGTNPIYVEGRRAVHFCSEFSVGLSWTHTLNRMSDEKMSVMINDVTLIVTDARLIYQSQDHKDPGVQYIGHLWFPWINKVGFRPKQSFLNDSILDIGYQEDFKLAARGMWSHRVELIFDKRFHPGDLAQQIVRRIAAHHLRVGVHEAVVDEVAALLEAPRLDDPEMGDTASYFLPAFVPIPGGVPYIPSAQEVAWSWMGPRIPVEDDDDEDDSGEGDEPPFAFRPESPVFIPAAAGSTTSSVESVHTQSGNRGRDERSVHSAPALDRRTRSRVMSMAVMAMFAHQMESYETSAQLHDQVLEEVGWCNPRIAMFHFRDFVDRCLEAHGRCGNLGAYREGALRALECVLDERDEELEFRVRRHLADALESEPEHDEFAPNLHRLSELTDDWCTRVERVAIHRSIALQALEQGLFGRAGIEFDLLADLHRSLGNATAEGIALQWKSRMDRECGRPEHADEAWERGTALLAGSPNGDTGDLDPPGDSG